jgi:chromosome segregation ATPase
MSDSEEAPVATNHHSDDSDDFEMDSDSDVQMSDHYRESGILISIVLVNFMCHKHMRVDFGPNVNFIYGPNGSGKSAILVGLQTCFGTRANETNRAGSMRDLIRDGQSEGSVTVRLANKGNGAYQHETFGDWIDVKRTLKAGGGASYRISNQWNKKEDSKRATLDAILGHFQIQITNPCIIMTQDTSREFLQSKEHKDKYNFFLRATLLEQIREENDKAYKAKVDKVTKRLEEAKDMESLKQEIKETVAKGAWASVVEAELVLDEAELEASKATKIFEKFLEKQQKIEGKLEELTKLQEEHDLEVQAVDTQLTSLKSEARQAKDKEKTVKAVANKAALKVKGLKSKMQPKQKKLKSVEENLNEALRDSKADVEKIQATLQKKIDKLMKKRDDAQAKITSVAEEEQTAKKEYEDLNNRHRSEEKQLEKYRHEVRETQDQIRQIQEAKKDALLKFGNHCPNVHKMIQQNLHKFEVPPLGPLGKYVELKDSHRDWGVACENQINKLQAYLVDNVRDYTLLAQIVKSCFKGHGQFPMIVTSKKTTRVVSVCECGCLYAYISSCMCVLLRLYSIRICRSAPTATWSR